MPKEHTPVPYKVCKEDPRNIRTYSGRGDLVAACCGEKTKENAQFIVRACNNHYTLLLAAESALDYLNDNMTLVEKERLKEDLKTIIKRAYA